MFGLIPKEEKFFQLFKEMTVFDNMLVAIASQEGGLSFLRPARNAAAQQRAAELLERFELSAHSHRTVGELPGGVRKLLDIAMALTRQPKVLLLDEPTSGVDVNTRHEVLLGRAIEGRRHKVLIVSKFGNIDLPDGKKGTNGRPEYVYSSCDASLERLGLDFHEVESDVGMMGGSAGGMKGMGGMGSGGGMPSGPMATTSPPKPMM